jgi:nitrite reductase/ring-hydroxylating ferredoxin subunit
MTTDTERLSAPRRGLRWLWSAGLAVPIILGAALVVIVAITFVSPRYITPREVRAGSVTEYTVGQPRYFEEQRFWLVQLPDGEFVALYDRDPITGCALPWGIGFEHMGRTGWFRDACSGAIYDLTGACFGGPCEIGLNRLNVRIEDGEIIVNPRNGPHGQLRSENGIPVNPPQ